MSVPVVVMETNMEETHEPLPIESPGTSPRHEGLRQAIDALNDLFDQGDCPQWVIIQLDDNHKFTNRYYYPDSPMPQVDYRTTVEGGMEERVIGPFVEVWEIDDVDEELADDSNWEVEDMQVNPDA